MIIDARINYETDSTGCKAEASTTTLLENFQPIGSHLIIMSSKAIAIIINIIILYN